MYTWIHLGTKNCSAFEPVLWSFHIAQHVRDTSAWKDGVAMVNGGCHPGNTPFNTIKKGIKKSNKGWIASRTRNTSMTWRKSFISSERTWKSCVLNVEMWYECVWKHTTRQPVKVWTTMYATTYKTGMWMDFLDVDPSAKKQGSRTNASKFTSRTNKKLQIFRVAFSRLGFYSPLCTWLNLGKLGWLQKTPKTITWWPWRNLTIAAPRGSVPAQRWSWPRSLDALRWSSSTRICPGRPREVMRKYVRKMVHPFGTCGMKQIQPKKRCGNVGELATQRCLIELANLSGQKANYMENMGQE